MQNEKTKRLTLTAMMIAIATVIAFICGLIPFLNFPFGGGITIASMLPIIIIAYMYGTKWGIFTGFCYSIIQMMLGHSTIAGLFMPNSDSYMMISYALLVCFIDYILAYTALGLGGIFRNRIKNKALSLCVGSIVALTVCYLMHVLSGFLFYGVWAEWFFTDVMPSIGESILATFSGKMLALIYSFIYNGCYMIPEIIITAVATLIIARIPYIKKTDFVVLKK